MKRLDINKPMIFCMICNHWGSVKVSGQTTYSNHQGVANSRGQGYVETEWHEELRRQKWRQMKHLNQWNQSKYHPMCSLNPTFSPFHGDFFLRFLVSRSLSPKPNEIPKLTVTGQVFLVTQLWVVERCSFSSDWKDSMISDYIQKTLLIPKLFPPKKKPNGWFFPFCVIPKSIHISTKKP